ncbi:MAG: hypothetical protein CYPHOPRED_003977, partial [Cyphobasidiales sp. Tagirdzhanova-0007]
GSHNSKIYEAVPAFGEIGAAVGMGKYGREVLEYLGDRDAWGGLKAVCSEVANGLAQDDVT